MSTTAKNSSGGGGGDGDGDGMGGSHKPKLSSTFLPPPPKFDPSSVNSPAKARSKTTTATGTGVSSSNKKTLVSLSSSMTAAGPMKSLLDLDQLPKPPPLPMPLSKKPSSFGSGSGSGSANAASLSSSSSASATRKKQTVSVDVKSVASASGIGINNRIGDKDVETIQGNSTNVNDIMVKDVGESDGSHNTTTSSSVLDMDMGEEKTLQSHDDPREEHVAIPPLQSAPPSLSGSNLQLLEELQKGREPEPELGSPEQSQFHLQQQQSTDNNPSVTTLVINTTPVTESEIETGTGVSDTGGIDGSNSSSANRSATVNNNNNNNNDTGPNDTTNTNANKTTKGLPLPHTNINPSSITMTEPPILKIRKHPKRSIKSIIHPHHQHKNRNSNNSSSINHRSSSSQMQTHAQMQMQMQMHQLLTHAQTSIPILVIASDMARSFIRKNQLEIEDLLNALAGSMFTDHTGMLGKMSPIRSAGRMMNLQWDQMSLQFLSNFHPHGQRRMRTGQGYGYAHGHGQGYEHGGEEIDANVNIAGKGTEQQDLEDVEERLGFCASVWEPYGEEGLETLEQQVEQLFHSHPDHGQSDYYGGNPNHNTTLHQIQSQSRNNPNSEGYGTDASSINEASAAALLSDSHTAWYARFQHAVNVQTSYLPHSMIHCPPVVLYVATTCPHPQEGVEGLASMVNSKENLPLEYHNGLFNPDGMRAQFLLLHDEGEYKKTIVAGSNSASTSTGGSTTGTVGSMSSVSGASDGKDSSSDFNEGKALNDMRNRFGPGCAAVVRVNSNETTTIDSDPHNDDDKDGGNEAEEEDPVFDAFIPPFSPSSYEELSKDTHNIRGLLLSARDKLALRRFIAQMVTMVVIPAVERRIHELNVEVTNHKKGVKNVFKSFWRKPKDGGGSGMSNSLHGMNQSSHNTGGKGGSNGGTMSGGGSEDVPYRYDSIESQTRLLADSLFLIRDFEGALGTYRIVRDDYKHDQNLLHNASTHEMMALCLCMTDLNTGYRSTREIIQYIDSSLYLYASAAEDDRLNSGGNRPVVASIATRCVTRLCLLLSAYRMLCNGRDMETADSLAAASSKETPLGAAVLLEQASGHYYSAGMVRKFAFHMLMAGHMFRSAEQEHHAVRCFASAMHVYHGGDRYWAELFNHLTSALAGQLYVMKRMQVSLQLYAKLVGTTGGGRVSVRSQQKFLDHLVTICRGHEKDALESVRRMKIVYYGGDNNELDEAEAVLNCTPKAKRILEIPNMNLPKIFDSTLKVENTSATHAVNSSNDDYVTFGNPAEGSESVWQDLTCCAQAELHVTTKSKSLHMEQMSKKVIEDIETERRKVSVAARLKKISSASDTPPSRAKLEPISVSFMVSNPLSVMVPVSSMQLVAKLTCAKTHRVFTNIEAINIDSDDAEPKKTKKWKFAGSDKMFEVAHFTRISPTTDARDDAWHSGSAEGTDPYFLVNKGKMAMDPGSKNVITLEICPLVMGELEIVGLRCKIFNEMWVYHKFKVLGPLLHNTAYNRANRVRGIPHLLRSTITSNMPSLSVDIIKTIGREEDSVVLQGQISKWVLRVSNQGAAPASNLCLKTNVPWFNISKSDRSNLDEVAATSHCIGPSGTMMKLPLGKGDVLNSGQTLDIPVEIRTSGGGKQEFYMLYRYELFERSTASKRTSAQPKFRWLRKMVTVPVYPSLTVTASLMPSFKDKNDHILSVEMTNYRSDKDSDLEIVMDKICVASKNYEVKPLAHHQGSLQKEASLANGYSISWQEQVTMHYLISPLQSSLSQCTLSECVLGMTDNQGTSDSSSMIDFISLEHAHDRFTSSLEEHQKRVAMIEAEKEIEGQHPRSIADIRRSSSAISTYTSEPENFTNGNDKNYHPTSRACLCSPHDSRSAEINVICSWKTKGLTDSPEDFIHGQHHLRQLAVRPQHKSKRCPLLISSKFDSCVQHDFSICPLNLDMEVSIRNRLVQSTVDFEFILESHQDFEFIGTERFRKTLDGGEEITFPLEAIIFQSGMYNLQCVKLTIFNSDGTRTPFVFPLQWMVQVNS